MTTLKVLKKLNNHAIVSYPVSTVVTDVKSDLHIQSRCKRKTRCHNVSLTMTTSLWICSKVDLCSFIQFFVLYSEGNEPVEINRRTKVRYCDACLSIPQVYV